MSYKVFIRNWYRLDANGKLAPAIGARKYTLDNVHTREEAIQACHEYNSTHKPGKLSRKAEFTEN